MKLYLSSCCTADVIWGDFVVDEMDLGEYAYRICECVECGYKWIEEFKFNRNIPTKNGGLTCYV